jgi:CheY-like chemotaxis protein/HPt (histidine-containing phosphotransfer) domain-containing protein
MENNNLDQEFLSLQNDYLLSLPEKFDELEQLIIQLEETSELDEILRVIKGIVHSIKGSAGSYDLEFISKVCHHFETCLEQIDPDKESVISYSKSKFFLQINDLLVEYVSSYGILPSFDQETFEKKFIEIIEGAGMEIDLSSINKEKEKKLIRDVDPSLYENPHRLLIVEPVKTFQTIYTNLFRNLPVEIKFESDGYNALGMLLKEKFDSLITSNKTKLLDGNGLIAGLKSSSGQNSNIHSILVTSDKEIKSNAEYTIFKNPHLPGEIRSIYEKLLGPHRENEGKKVSKSLSSILYIDDDKDIHPLIKSYLKSDEIENVKICSSGEEAMEVIKEYSPDMVILDVFMPGMDGPSFIKIIKNHKQFEELKNIPFVFITGNTNLDEIEQYKLLGATDVITKPLNFKKLPERLAEIYSSYLKNC